MDPQKLFEQSFGISKRRNKEKNNRETTPIYDHGICAVFFMYGNILENDV